MRQNPDREETAMTMREIEALLERVKTWPLPQQEDAAHALLRMEELGTTPYQLSPEEERDIEEGEASGVATDEEVEAFFGRYRG